MSEVFSTKIEGETVTVRGEFVTVEDFYIAIRFANRVDALIGAFCYKGQSSKIEKSATGGSILVVYKKGAKAAGFDSVH